MCPAELHEHRAETHLFRDSHPCTILAEGLGFPKFMCLYPFF